MDQENDPVYRMERGLLAIKETSTDSASRQLAASLLAALPVAINSVLDNILAQFNSQHDEDKHQIDDDRYCMDCTPAEQLIEKARLPLWFGGNDGEAKNQGRR